MRRGMRQGNGECPGLHRLSQMNISHSFVVITKEGDGITPVVRHVEVAHAEGHAIFGMPHQHGFQGMVEVVVKTELHRTDQLRLIPFKPDEWRWVVRIRHPGIGHDMWPIHPVAQIIRAEYRYAIVKGDGEVPATGPPARTPEFEGIEAYTLGGRLPTVIGYGNVDMIEQGEYATYPHIGQWNTDRLIAEQHKIKVPVILK